MKKEEIRTSAGYFEEAKQFVEDMLNKDGICLEVLFGGIINIINVIGDIVTVAASEDR